MTKTLILLFHHDLSRSRANAALAAAAGSVPGTEVVDMQALYPAGEIDAGREAARLLSADRLVLQFPLMWYSAPPLLKAWQNAVLTRMYYIAYEAEGRKFEGTPLKLAVTAGNVPEAYSPSGINLFPLDEILKPLRSMASRYALPWSDPFLLYRADKLSDGAREEAAHRYVAELRGWIAEITPAEAPARSRQLVPVQG
ncbi:NAD(P)H-dependent oxidoreductase [Chelativorans sp. AA-79]|uniref:NAD(P)H-dependent oxidoreductase n=1 Tax=Chelativorans sp. AA-79 TaxID=3028735 RepID=UPI0023F8A792|nr:NAD(P)H-dependent oxidoreductase [Chelativorans sp. AA-79]WEX07862.1 NAD(P)H-dependent oxidoreductase [Chelativorans sp. AA-79]